MNIKHALSGALALALVATPAAAISFPDFLFDNTDLRTQKARPHSHKRFRRSRARAPLIDGAIVLASFYGGGEYLNHRTANGEVFRANGLTAAHRTLPFSTLLSVCYRRCVTVRINDRGPAGWTGRSLDLSKAAASAIGMIGAGVARVRMKHVSDNH
jgi:rare lipoprotein A